MTPKLIITGFMATGKSSTGPLVARRLGWEFVDVDSVIVASAGKPIAQIFTDHGEAISAGSNAKWSHIWPAITGDAPIATGRFPR